MNIERGVIPCRMIVGEKKKERGKRKGGGGKNEYPRTERENSMADKISSQPLAICDKRLARSNARMSTRNIKIHMCVDGIITLIGMTENLGDALAPRRVIGASSPVLGIIRLTEHRAATRTSSVKFGKKRLQWIRGLSVSRDLIASSSTRSTESTSEPGQAVT